MRIDVTFTPGELKAYLANSDRNHRRLIVIIDVLRATTTIITALKNKAIWVLPVLAPEEAFEMKKVYGDAILAGE
ncbi:MAG TPA: 2-phosphosulfolactate phosphatase, partial [Firmicutes bacterium]|nr:2-phosphosulfolactate phosphatase [Bacillota bacterium]